MQKMDDGVSGLVVLIKGVLMTLFAVAIIGCLLAIFQWFAVSFYDWPQSAGEFGDMFGLANAFFSGLAFAGVICALYLQRQDLENTKRENRQFRRRQEAAVRPFFHWENNTGVPNAKIFTATNAGAKIFKLRAYHSWNEKDVGLEIRPKEFWMPRDEGETPQKLVLEFAGKQPEDWKDGTPKIRVAICFENLLGEQGMHCFEIVGNGNPKTLDELLDTTKMKPAK